MKKKKILNTVVNVIVILIAVIVLVIAITSIASMDKGYNSYFGYASVAVRTGSMQGDLPDSFNEGDMLFVKVLTKEEQLDLKFDDVVTFWDIIEGKQALNTHRIVSVNEMTDQDGAIIAKSYVTKGDHNAVKDDVPVNYDRVIGKYTGNRAAGLGSVALFIQGSTGFLCLVVIPSLLLLIYAVIRLILSILQIKKEKSAAAIFGTEVSDEQRERIRRELLEELSRKEGGNGQDAGESDPQ